jgi:hypothetical protein
MALLRSKSRPGKTLSKRRRPIDFPQFVRFPGGLSLEAMKIQVVRMLENQTTVLLLPFRRGEGRDEGSGFGVRGSW